MTNYAYLRVSTDKQDINNQKQSVKRYAKANNITNLQYVEDTAPGHKDWQERRIGKIINETMQPGDTLVVAEISRLGRSTLDVLDIMRTAAERELRIHVAKQNLQLDGTLNSKIIATSLALAAEIEREFISMRTKEGLERAKAEGQTLGRPPGSTHINPHLHRKKKEIENMLKKNIPKTTIAKMFDVAPNTLRKFLKDTGLYEKYSKT